MTSESIGWWAVNPVACFNSLGGLCLCELPGLSYGTFLSCYWHPYQLLIVSCRLKELFLFSKKKSFLASTIWELLLQRVLLSAFLLCLWQQEGTWVTLLAASSPCTPEMLNQGNNAMDEKFHPNNLLWFNPLYSSFYSQGNTDCLGCLVGFSLSQLLGIKQRR